MFYYSKYVEKHNIIDMFKHEQYCSVNFIDIISLYQASNIDHFLK